MRHGRRKHPRQYRVLLLSVTGLIGVAALTAVLEIGSHTVPGAARGSPAKHAGAIGGTVTATGHPPKVARHHPRPRPRPSPRATQAPALASNCGGAPDHPGGADPWGSCWPGPQNTGPAPGTTFTPYQGPVVVSTNNTVISGKIITNQGLVIEASGVVIKDSIVDQTTIQNRGGQPLLIENTKINGGSQLEFPSVGGSNVTVLRDNIYGGQHEVDCAGNCVVEDSWLHDNANGAAAGSHQNGFFNNGGSNFLIRHNTVYCVGGCTADISFIPDGDISNAVVTKNFLMATAYAGYCLDPSSDAPAKPGIVNQMTVTDNVFGRGATGKCAVYGPVGGWDTPNSRRGTDGYGNIWSGNTWDDARPLSG